MQLGPKEKSVVVKAVAVFVFAVAAPSYLAEEAGAYRQREVQRQTQLRSQHADLQNKLSGIEEQRRLFRRNLTSYNRWQERGLISPNFDPTEWVKTMKAIKEKRRLGAINYDVGDRVKVDTTNSMYTDTEGGSASIHMVPMRVAMPMLHDMDIFMFLEDLASQVDELFFPVSCNITRLQDGFSPVVRENARGECDLVWVFMEDPDQGKGVL